MKKLSILAVSVLAISSVALAQTKKAPTSLKCAVMKEHSVKIADAVKSGNFADYKGRRYVFCCGGCKPSFQKNPAKYAKAESIPAPKKPS